MANEEVLGPRKTMFVLVVVVGCFAVLWPRILSPMVLGPSRDQLKPNQYDRDAGCCEVIFETEVAVLELLNEVCSTITPSGKTSPYAAAECRRTVNETCGVDIQMFLKRSDNVGKTTKVLLDIMKASNSSCLKEHFGVPIWSMSLHPAFNSWALKDTLKQERSPIRPGPHPALLERGRAIPSSAAPPAPRPAPLPPHLRVRTSPLQGYFEIDVKPPPIPGMRPPLGAGSGPLPAPKSSMGFLMPVYTICIIVFFVYTLSKILFKRTGSSYDQISPDPQFRRRVFRDDSRTSPDKLVVTAISGLVAEVQQQMEASYAHNQQRQELQDNHARPYTNGTVIHSGPVQIVASEYREPSKEKNPVKEKEHSPEPKEASPVPKEASPELKEASPEPKETSPEPKETSPEPKETSPEPKEASPGPKEASPEPKEASPEPKEASPEPKEASPELKEASPEPKEASPEPKQASPEPEQASPEPKQSSPERTPETKESSPEEEEEEEIEEEISEEASPEKEIVIEELKKITDNIEILKDSVVKLTEDFLHKEKFKEDGSRAMMMPRHGHGKRTTSELLEEALKEDSPGKDENATVKVLGMEVSQWSEGGALPRPRQRRAPQRPAHEAEKVQSIYLDTEIPQQSRVLVADFADTADKTPSTKHAPLVVSGKMTLSLIQDAPRDTPERDPESTVDEFTTASAVTQPNDEKEEELSDEEIEEEIEVEEIEEEVEEEVEEVEEEEEDPPANQNAHK